MNYKKDSLGNRMKSYERKGEVYLPEDRPVILRLDGKAFHTYTKGMVRPFDEALSAAMKQTLKFLCEQVSGCRFGYTQSDEITLILTADVSVSAYGKHYAPWFNNRLQKIITTAASLCTFEFNRIMYPKTNKIAVFDCRAISVPDYVEAANNVFWRQLDARRNSVSMFAQANYTQKQLNGLSCEQMKEKLREEKGLVWDDQIAYQKWGVVCKKDKDNGGWAIDENTPLLKEDWEYIYGEIPHS